MIGVGKPRIYIDYISWLHALGKRPKTENCGIGFDVDKEYTIETDGTTSLVNFQVGSWYSDDEDNLNIPKNIKFNYFALLGHNLREENPISFQLYKKDIDNDNVNEIEVNQTTSVEDGVSLSFSPPFRSMTPHYTDSTTGRYAMEANSGGSIKSSFTITCTAGSGRPFSNPNAPTIDDLCVVKTVNIGSAALPIEGENVSSSTYYRWPVSNIVGLSDGMVLDPTRTSNAVIDSRIGSYSAEKSTNEIIEREYYNDVKTITINDINVDGVSASSNSVTAIDVYGAATAQEGNVTFDVQQPDALKSDTNVKLIGYGVDQIRTVTGANVELSNVTIELTQISTTTTSRTINSTTIPVAEVGGIGADATIRGIGINSTVALPTVTFKNVATGAGNLTASAAQSLESGATLFFDGTGTVATIKGDIKISIVPTSDTTFYFDIERFLDAL